MKYMCRFYHRLDDTSGMQGPFPLADAKCTITSRQQEGLPKAIRYGTQRAHWRQPGSRPE
jgi:hypothetical protein